jgi:hypothetical protein
MENQLEIIEEKAQAEEPKKKRKILFDERLQAIGTSLKANFESLRTAQETFINYCKFSGRLLFIENERLTEEELSFSDAYKIEKVLKTVLALEYKDDVTFFAKGGSTETFHAVIALPVEAESIINNINDLKDMIGSLLTVTVDSRTKVDGKWLPMNKELMRAVGVPRGNAKQIRRRLNAHHHDYTRISYSGTSQRPIYNKSFEQIQDMLKEFTSKQSELDLKILEDHKNADQFALYYNKYYTSMDGNFKFKAPVTRIMKNGKERLLSIFTQKISSPIYLLCEENVADVELEVKYKVTEKPNAREDFKMLISDKPILKSLPVYVTRKAK